MNRVSGFKKLCMGSTFLAGRNNGGRITIRHRGGGTRRVYRFVNQKPINLVGLVGKIIKIMTDPRRSGYIASVIYSNGYGGYIPLVEDCWVGDYFMYTENGGLYDQRIMRKGSGFYLKYVKEGESVCYLEWHNGKGSKIAKAAGTGVLVVKQYSDRHKTLVKNR